MPPSRATSVPAGMPKIATAPSPPPAPSPCGAAEPVVTKTNHGSATNVIEEPVSETSSAAIEAERSERSRQIDMARDNKTSVRFCKVEPCRRSARSTRRPAAADPRRARSAASPATATAARRSREARAGDRPLARRDLQLLRRQAGALRGGRDADQRPLRGARRRRGASTRPSGRWRPRTRTGSRVLLETQGKLRHDPAFVRRLEEAIARARHGSAPWIEARQRDGTFRDDVAGETARDEFVGMLLNGLALRVAGGDADRRRVAAAAPARRTRAARLAPSSIRPAMGDPPSSCRLDLAHYRELLAAARAAGYDWASFDRHPRRGDLFLRHDVRDLARGGARAGPDRARPRRSGGPTC